jgi:aldose 1-epimerase
MPPDRNFGVRADGQVVTAHEIASPAGCRAIILNQGAILQSFYLPDGRNVTLGFQDWSGYASDNGYKGRIIGRNANRIAGANFEIDGQRTNLVANDGPHNLHSGPQGMDIQLWDVRRSDSGLELRHSSPDGHDGFPGEVEVLLQISLRNTTLRLEMEATASRPTPVNLTWHPYWNLAGYGGIDDHNLQIISGHVTELETGAAIPIKNTPFDFQRRRPLGKVQLDTNYSGVNSANLTFNETQLNVTSSLPDMQIYTGDNLLQPRSGVAIEPQFQPNDINMLQDSLLRPGDIYHHWIEYKFNLS